VRRSGGSGRRRPKRSPDGFRDFAAKFNDLVIEDANLRLTGEAKVVDLFMIRTELDLVIVCTPKEGAGEGAAQLKQPQSSFRRMLSEADPKSQFIFFLARPDSIDVFCAARELAATMQLSTGWSPLRPGEPALFALTGRRSQCACGFSPAVRAPSGGVAVGPRRQGRARAGRPAAGLACHRHPFEHGDELLHELRAVVVPSAGADEVAVDHAGFVHVVASKLRDIQGAFGHGGHGAAL